MSDWVKAAILSDVHGNTPALEAVLADVRSQGCTRLFFLGDIINGVDPHGSLETLLSWGPVECLQGNAEAYTFTPDLDRFPHKDETFYQELFVLLDWFKEKLTPADQDLISAWPEVLWWQEACLVHDSPLDRLFKEEWRDPDLEEKYQEITFHSSGLPRDLAADKIERLASFMDARGLKQVFSGHTHIPYRWQLDRKLVCNVGSVGMPLDGDPRAAWTLVETQPGVEIHVSQRRIEYDVDRTLRLLDDTPDYPDWKRPGMQEAYKRMIASGMHWKVFLR